MKYKRLFFLLLSVFVLTLAARAASTPQILQQTLDPDTRQWTLYVRHGGGAEVQGVRINGTEVENAAIAKDASETRLVTWLLFDTSESMPEELRAKALDLLLTLLGEKGRAETHNFCTFSDRLAVKVRDSGSFTDLKQQIDTLEYSGAKADLMGALREILTEEASRAGTEFVRILVISAGGDGVPADKDTQTLRDRLREHNVPIYTVGCATESNADILSWMYALSVRTHARSWDIRQAGAADIANIMHWEEIPVRVSLSVPEELSGVPLRDIEVTFSDGTSARVSVSGSVGPVTEEVSPVTEAAESPDTLSARLLALSLMLSLGLIGAVVFRFRKHKTADAPRPASAYVPAGEDSSMTLCLQDAEHPERRFRAPLRKRVTIGRSADNVIVLDYDKSVSRTHCEIYLLNSELWIHDCNSSGGTYVENTRVTDTMKFSNGAEIRLGHVRYKVELQPADG